MIAKFDVAYLNSYVNMIVFCSVIKDNDFCHILSIFKKKTTTAKKVNFFSSAMHADRVEVDELNSGLS